MNILPIYLPKIPIVNNWKPPRKRIIEIIEGQPDVGSPKIKVRIMTIMIRKNANKQATTPPTKAIVNGASEKLIIPSKE